MSDTASWKPVVFAPRTAAAIVEAVDEIASDLMCVPSAGSSCFRLAESALFFAYLAIQRRDPNYAAVAADRLRASIDRLAHITAGPALFGGVAGIGWIVHHVSSMRLDAEVEAVDCQYIDDYLVECSEVGAGSCPYDLVSGLVGFGVYFLERLPSTRATYGLERLVDLLWLRAIRQGGEVVWHTAPHLLPPWQRALMPTGYFNFGMAHGVPGVIAFLSRCIQANIAVTQASMLLEGAVTWLISNRNQISGNGCFPAWKEKLSQPAQATRLAWCYGDIGPGLGLVSAGRALNRSDWIRYGLEVLEGSTKRGGRASGVTDAGLCHGSAGLFHAYARSSRRLRSSVLNAAAEDWLRVTLGMRMPGGFAGGFGAYRPSDNDAADAWSDDTSLLTGTVGIGLALMSCLSNYEPKWDRLLMMDVP
jgi:lantibiotic modifying enzyme